MDLSSIKEAYNPGIYNETRGEILDIDVILDKINEKGLKSLTNNEKEFLDKQKNKNI